MTATTPAPAQAPANVLRERLEDLHELRGRIDAEIADVEHRLRRIERFEELVTPAGVDSAAVRAWGRDHGWTLGDRGRLPADLLHAYLNRRPE